jgi:hypothetical protein
MCVNSIARIKTNEISQKLEATVAVSSSSILTNSAPHSGQSSQLLLTTTEQEALGLPIF